MLIWQEQSLIIQVLIVAKCNVNGRIVTNCDGRKAVLIVAKCNVNLFPNFQF